jgi:transmembrane sensor
MSLVRDELRRWFGIELVVTDSALERRHLTTTFDMNAPARALDVIGLALGAAVERRGDTAIVGGRPR